MRCSVICTVFDLCRCCSVCSALLIFLSSICFLSLGSCHQDALLTLCKSLSFPTAMCAPLCRPSRGTVLLLGGPLPQRDAPPLRPVRQNQRCVGDPQRVAAAHQASWERAVWGGLDGYESSGKRGDMKGPQRASRASVQNTPASDLGWGWSLHHKNLELPGGTWDVVNGVQSLCCSKMASSMGLAACSRS